MTRSTREHHHIFQTPYHLSHPAPVQPPSSPPPPPPPTTTVITTTKQTTQSQEYAKKTEEPTEEPAERLQDIAARLLYHTVKWARSVPAFSELKRCDRRKLLENSWADIFMLFAFQWNLLIDPNEILKSIGHERLKEESIEECLSSGLKLLEELSIKFRLFNVSEDEFIYLKSIALFKPGKAIYFDNTFL